ncbi:unnamed protein product [Thlaspi arvense]|uniref:Uncharacterized protein n=1 Tax=Thlaspi arvense TaxID=13288 RepID=A0AAU9S622_THLAR|nr:unnamed protein product [Thlaspi arvense]
MDFDSLPRRDLQFFCKKNKIPANMTNVAMADALKALEIVEGIEEFANQSPTSVAKNLPSAARTAARTTRRKTKDETQSSDLVTRSCNVTTKSLAGELEQENRDANVLQNPSVPQGRRGAAVTSIAIDLGATDLKPETNVSKTPAPRSTRRAQAAASSKKDESVQRVYSTRRSVKLLEESMADLSLKTNESLNVPAKKHEDAEREDLPAGSNFQAKSDDNSEKTEEAEVISVRDLNYSLEKEWDGSKSDPDLDVLYGDLGDITFSDATSKEQMNGTESNTVPASDSFVQVEDDDSGGVVDTNQEAFGSKVTASDDASKVDSVPTVLMADESEELESDNDSEESFKPEEPMDHESEVPPVSDKTKTQASSSTLPLDRKYHESDSDEWSDFEIDISETEENSCGSEELIDSESEEAPVSDKKIPASSSTLAGKGSFSDPNKSALEAASVADNMNKENAEETVLNNNGERKVEAEDKKKKKTIDEESLKDVSMRQLTKMVKEFTIKSKQQHKCLE